MFPVRNVAVGVIFRMFRGLIVAATSFHLRHALDWIFCLGSRLGR